MLSDDDDGVGDDLWRWLPRYAALSVVELCEAGLLWKNYVPYVTWLGDRKGIRPVKKTGCWFVGGDDLTGALHDL